MSGSLKELAAVLSLEPASASALGGKDNAAEDMDDVIGQDDLRLMGIDGMYCNCGRTVETVGKFTAATE